MGSAVSKVSYDVRVPVRKHLIKNIVMDTTPLVSDVSGIVADYAQNLFIKYLCDKWNKIFSDKKDTLPDLNLANYKVDTQEACYILHALYVKHHSSHDGSLLITIFENKEHTLIEVITFHDKSGNFKYKIMNSPDGRFNYHKINFNLEQTSETKTVDNFIIFFDKMINFYISKQTIGRDHYLFKSCKPPIEIPPFSPQHKQHAKQYVDGVEVPLMDQVDGGFFNRSKNLFPYFHHCY